MAHKTLSIFLFVAIMATSIAEAQSQIGNVHINGTLYCSTNGESGSSKAPLFLNAMVKVFCPTNVANSPNATSKKSGRYMVVLVPEIGATVDSIVSNCRLTVLTPLSKCNPNLPPIGLLSNLRFVKTIQKKVTYMVAAGWALQG